MIGDYPNLPEADNQPTPQPLILPGYADNIQESFLDAQPTTMDIQQYLEIQQPFAQQPFSDMKQPFTQPQIGYPYADPVRPEHLLYSPSSSPFTHPFAKLVNLWRSDPAYKVFLIALATVLISGIACMILISNLLKQQSSSQTPIADKTTVMSDSTPVNISTPIATLIPIPLPTSAIDSKNSLAPLNAPSHLTVDITSIPSTVINNTTTSLGVKTNEPKVHITLHVTYSGASPASFKGTSAKTNSNGQTALSWPVRVRPTKKFSTVTAHVTVFAQDTHGQTATSQTVTVQVFTFQAE